MAATLKGTRGAIEAALGGTAITVEARRSALRRARGCAVIEATWRGATVLARRAWRARAIVHAQLGALVGARAAIVRPRAAIALEARTIVLGWTSLRLGPRGAHA